MLLYKILVALIARFGCLATSKYQENKKFRQVVGGYWGKWRAGSGSALSCTLWLPSVCEHYPPLRSTDTLLEKESYPTTKYTAKLFAKE